MLARRLDLALDLRRGQALHALFKNEAADAFLPADLAIGVGQLGPDHEHVGDRRVGDPHLRALHEVAAVHRHGAGDHAGRVGAVVGLGQAEAADPFAGGQLGQVLLALGFGAVFVDRVHHQRRLHADRAAVAAVHALHLARDQAVGHVAQARAAITLDRGAQEPHGTGLVHDLAVKFLVARGHQHAGLQLLLAEGVGGLDDGPLVVVELFGQQKRVFPVEFGFHRRSPGWKVLSEIVGQSRIVV